MRSNPVLALAIAALAFSAARADDFAPTVDLDAIVPDPQKGYEILLTVPMADPIIKTKDVDRIWQVWEPAEKAKAEAASPADRHRMTFERYGLMDRPNDKSGLPLGYTEDGKGNLVTNCFSCHAGKVGGVVIPALGNSHHDITALATDVARLKALDAGEDPAAIPDQTATFKTPYNMHKGVSNATMFAFILGVWRDKNTDLIKTPANPTAFLKHNDLVAPPWWNYKHKDWIYCDAFGGKTPRSLMQFTMSLGNTGDMIRGWEGDFIHIQAYIQNVQPPKYPYAVDAKLAEKGRDAFDLTCARCHGTYGKDAKYPNKVIPIDKIGTDRVRFDAIPALARAQYNTTWWSDYGKHPIPVKTEGYIAQPLNGIWAKSGYLHNGSVPTIQALFNPAERPKVWKRDENGYDQKKIGMVVEAFDEIPEGLNPRERRMYYDTRTPSHGAEGHLFPDQELTAEEKVAVMEYLKTL